MANPIPRRTGILLAGVVALAALSVGLFKHASMPPASNTQFAESSKAPEIELKTLDGKNYKLSADTNKVVVVDFWATWCPPCRKGLPKLQETANWVEKDKLKVSIFAVNIQEEKDDVKKFWTDNKFTMGVLMDTEGAVAQAYNVQAIPTTVVIVDGKVTKLFRGLSPKMEEELKAAIQDGLKQTEKSEKK